ncbi:hypothetical protein Tco_1187868 [Tanacetum coccineum]
MIWTLRVWTVLKNEVKSSWKTFHNKKRYAKDPTEIHGIKRRQNEGFQAFMYRFKFESSHITGVPSVFSVSAFMHGHGHPELAKKLNNKIPKTVDEMFERVRAFIRGEVATGSTEMVRPPQWDKGNVRSAWSGGPKKAKNKGGPRETRRNMGIYTPYPRKDTFTLLIKTPKEILAMENIEEVVASGKLAHLVIDIRPKNQRNGSQGKNNIKVINMVRGGRNHKRPFEGERSCLTDELTFPAIPQNQQMDEPIILEGMIEDHQAKKVQSSADRFLRRNIPPFGDNRPSSNYGRDIKEQNGADGVCDSKMSFSVQRYNRNNQNEKSRSDRQLEKVQGSWKEVQWHQREEQMSRIIEQAILRTKSSFGHRPNQGLMPLEETRNK